MEALEWNGEGILVRFSRYMEEDGVLDPASYALSDGEGVPCAVTAVTPVEQGRVSVNIDPEEPTYTRAVLLTADFPAGAALRLTVRGGLKSYAGASSKDYTGFVATAETGTLGDHSELQWVRLPDGALGVSGRGMSARTPVFAALYDANGKMLGVRLFESSGQAADIGTEFARCKLFWLDENGRPKCECVTVK